MIVSQIQWTDATWNIARGCTKVNEDCKFCYMMRDGDRYKYDAKTVIKTKTVFNMPLKYKETKSSVWPGAPLIFTSSLTDWAHPDIDSYRHEMWDIIRTRKDLTFQLLTKRPERLLDILPLDWGIGYDNVWLGTSIGSMKSIDKIEHLCKVDAKVRFLSIEPLIGPITEFIPIDYADGSPMINWVIVGGESGNDVGKWNYRPCHVDWIHDIVAQCKMAGVPVFVKQLGTHVSKEWALKDRHGGNIEEFPQSLRVRQFPNILTHGFIN